MQQCINSSFGTRQPDYFRHSPKVLVLKPRHSNTDPPKAGSETLCVWSNDYFAWSCGNRIVQLVPWNSHNVLNKLNPPEEACAASSCVDICKDIDWNQVLTLDCGALVWSLALGLVTSDSKPRLWRHFNFTKDPILATGLLNGHIELWDCRTGCLLMELLDHKDVIRDLHFSPDNSVRLASASRDGTIKLWDLNDDGNMYQTLWTEARRVYACCWSPDASMLACAGDYKSVVIWEMNKKYSVRKLLGHHHDVVCCRFSCDGAVLATASYDSRVILWDPHIGDIISELHHMYPPPSPIFAGGSNDHYVRGLSFSPHGPWLSTVCDDGYLRFWDTLSPREPQAIAPTSNALCCVYNPSGTLVAVGSRNGHVSFYEVPTQVASLQHFCRMTIRKRIPSTKVDFLFLPNQLKEFLKYKD